MKAAANAVVVIGLMSLVVGIISRLTLTPLGFFPGTLNAETMLQFTNTCMLIAIALLLLEKAK